MDGLLSEGIKEIFTKLQKDGNDTVENILKWLKNAKMINEDFTMSKALSLFGGLVGKDKVDLPKFQEVLGKIEATKIIDEKFTMSQASSLFGGLVSKDKVDLPKFQEVLGKIASEQKMALGDLQKKLMDEEGPNLVAQAAKSGFGALQNALK